MAIITVDYETFYSPQYTLKTMSTQDYILDERFQVIMAAVKVDQGPSEVFVGHKAVARRLAEIDWDSSAFLSHNVRFDGAILAWRFGIEPKMYLDTLAMARATVYWKKGSSSLKAVADYLELPPKGDEVTRAIGKRLEDFDPIELVDYASYCKNDNDLCREIFDRMSGVFTASELKFMDLLARMFILPQVTLDQGVLAEHLADVKRQRENALNKVAHIDKSVFSSNQKFAKLLQDHGVDVPMKTSPTTTQEIPALSKSDWGFKELCADESQPIEVQALLMARLGAKSTLEETRTYKLLQSSLSCWPSPTTGANTQPRWGTVPIQYYGARTGRVSGIDQVNWLNLRRGSRVREAITAPPGHRIVHRDASQIEARMVAWLAGCTHLVQAYAQGVDVYAMFASAVYGKTTVTKQERFIGKTCTLGLGYGTGAHKLQHTLYIGNGGMSVRVDDNEAQRLVDHYRSEYGEIPILWKTCEFLLQRIIARSGNSTASQMYTRRTWNDQDLIDLQALARPGYDALWLPNKMCVSYPNLRYERDPSRNQHFDMVYDNPRGNAAIKIYGAKCLENISQALSRIIVTDIAVRMFNTTGYHPFLHTYDSLDYCVPACDVEWWDKILTQEFARKPDWAVGLPLASEGGWGNTLASAERGDNT